MLSDERIPKERRIAIFQKMADISFSRMFRTCKWVNQFIEDNKEHIKIHSTLGLHFQYQFDDIPGSGGMRAIRHVIHIYRHPVGGGFAVTDEGYYMPVKLRELHKVLLERFSCFVFSKVVQKPCPIAFIDDDNYVLERMTTVPADQLWIMKPIYGSIPTSRYNYKTVYFLGIEPDAIDSFFDSVQLHKIVAFELEADERVVSSVVSRCCEQMQKILDGEYVTESMRITFQADVNQPEHLNSFLEEHKSERIVLAEGIHFHIIPASRKTFLAFEWKKTDKSLCKFTLMNNRHDFVRYCRLSYPIPPPLPTIDEISSIPAVQSICDRFFP